MKITNNNRQCKFTFGVDKMYVCLVDKMYLKMFQLQYLFHWIEDKKRIRMRMKIATGETSGYRSGSECT
jgi:hypothetical protein